MTTVKKPSKGGVKKTETTKRKVGRPTIKTDVLMDEFCNLLVDGVNGKPCSTRKACQILGLSFSVFYRWLDNDDEFKKRYARAKELQAEGYADEIVDISEEPPELVVDDAGAARIDSAFVQYQKLRIEARKWVSARLLPKKYGEKIQQEVTGANGGPIQQSIVTPEQLDEAIKNGIRNKF